MTKTLHKTLQHVTRLWYRSGVGLAGVGVLGSRECGGLGAVAFWSKECWGYGVWGFTDVGSLGVWRSRGRFWCGGMGESVEIFNELTHNKLVDIFYVDLACVDLGCRSSPWRSSLCRSIDPVMPLKCKITKFVTLQHCNTAIVVPCFILWHIW